MATPINLIQTITLPDEKTYQLSSVLYGECSTAAGTQAKTVTIPGVAELNESNAGLSIYVKFENNQTYNGTPTLNVNGIGAKNIRRNGTTNAARYEWAAGEILNFVFDGTYWVIVDGNFATTTYYGVTKLATSATSTSTGLALTPASLNSLVSNMVSGYPVYSATATYAVGDRVRYEWSTWECTTAISSAEAWTASHWKELDSLQDQVDDIISLPETTAADNGKILRVVNGAWQKHTLLSANGVSF